MFLTPRRIFIFCGCLLLMVGTALYIYQQSKSVSEPITIYEKTNFPLKQDSTVTSSNVKAVPTESLAAESPQAGHVHMPKSQRNKSQRDKMSKEDPVTTLPAADATDTSLPMAENDVLSEEAIKRWVDEVITELQQLNTKFMEKYPELLDIAMMTKEEFLEKYPTPESQQELLEYAKRVRPEMFTEVRAVFSSIPIEIIEDLLLEAKDHLVKMWGQEIAEQAIQNVQKELGL